MAFQIVAEEKQYHRDAGYQAKQERNSVNLSDFDKWVIEKRVKQENHRWFSTQIFKIIAGVAIGIFIAKTLNG